MLQFEEEDYLIDSLDQALEAVREEEMNAVIDELSINVQDHHWLVYCALGGHEHYDLPEIDQQSGIRILEVYAEAA
jgi:nickel-dependent lactate racemase